MAARTTWWPVFAGLVLVAVLGTACGDDDDPGAIATAPARDDGGTTVEQGTVANLGPYRIGLVSVDAANHSAVVSIFRPDGSTLPNATLTVGTPLRIAGGRLELLETKDGGVQRDTVRLRFAPE
jgi:hypothetical protein